MQEARERAGVTKAALAREVGVDVRTITRWEAGETEPDAMSAMVIARRIGVSLDWMLTGATAAEPNAESAAESEAAA